MNEDTLFRAIGNVDDAMIEKYVPQKPPQWPRYLSCAALICLIASLVLPTIFVPDKGGESLSDYSMSFWQYGLYFSDNGLIEDWIVRVVVRTTLDMNI